MQEKPTLLINESTIRELMTMEDYIHIADHVYRGMDDGTVINPTKLTLDLGETGNYPNYSGFANAMPAYIGWQDSAGLKWVTGFNGKRKEAGLPFINGLITLLDPQMGSFLAVMDGTDITNVRTGAQTATALTYLLDQESVTLGIYGAGMQAYMNTQAINERFDIDEILIWNRTKSKAEDFKENVEPKIKGKVTVVDEPKEVAKAQVLITVTSANEPLVHSEWVQPGTIIFPLGSFQEISDNVALAADKLIVDHPGQALHRGALKHLNKAGKITEDDVFATLGELANGKKEVGDLSNDIVLCIPIGIGAIDVAVASEIYDRAREQGLGQTFDFKS
ncbi:ornithine cyclodeaminase family protein [Aerococcus kribbianus]|uniref:Ornithine cyclodeaminase family protein n=1 Tax=Aerococcus kribbianus TaxID=2999064 RepID=A0A9X3FR84_9LACT|nr:MULTISPECIES: ornithine cyclodeaminase family protein [unclassified Aerococcus]MCZ0716882.1 ornithine cyclodeaminase family protein [Aerococcus sp. YH-aer221]MCZ0725170.1 ornithine cyclodeaminase family protein [Aerococcus sp. YH-aer222]